MVDGGEQKGVTSGGLKREQLEGSTRGNFVKDSDMTGGKEAQLRKQLKHCGTMEAGRQWVMGYSVSLYLGLLDYWPAVKCT